MRFDQLVGGIALDHYRVVEKQHAALSIIPPNTPALRKRCGASKQSSQRFESGFDPKILLNLGVEAIVTRNEQYE